MGPGAGLVQWYSSTAVRGTPCTTQVLVAGNRTINKFSDSKIMGPGAGLVHLSFKNAEVAKLITKFI
eukprot:SAG31_NODE_4376_length_3293_cov_15.160301_2_plen_67_part_00